MPGKKRINPYKLETFRQYDECSIVYYLTDEKNHTEAMFCDFTNSSGNQRYYFSKNAPITSNWMELFGYGEADWIDSSESVNPMELLHDAVLYVPKIKSLDDPENGSYMKEFKGESIEETLNSCLYYLNALLGAYPALSFLYPGFFGVIKELLLFSDGKKSQKQVIKDLYNPLLYLSYNAGAAVEYYDRIRTYVYDVFIMPFEKNIMLAPDKVAEHYKNYCNLYYNEGDEASIKRDFFSNSTSERSPNAGMIEQAPADPGWESYIETRNSYDTEGIGIYTLNQFAHIGIAQLIRDGRSIRKCKLCGKYFKVKYSSSQEYCTRIYKDSKFACNEYMSRRSAKDRFFEHPIHAEYNKAYNRLYARIRRGKVPKDTPLTAKLKELHDQYYERYEHTHKKDREAVWKEYIEKNKELLA
ncbi:MAG: DUF6076 domain-containing protein [Lachnospiraceae bacterium]|nr:DUF6076 domain-containing protein [Lachnospiraceae bacterium]